jgi:hypothetical protein
MARLGWPVWVQTGRVKHLLPYASLKAIKTARSALAACGPSVWPTVVWKSFLSGERQGRRRRGTVKTTFSWRLCHPCLAALQAG